MPYTTDIEKALDQLVSDEAGPKFQGLAVVLAKQRWPRLVASERKWDLGLDAYASGGMEPDGYGFGLACSLTPEYEKLAADATKVKKNFPDVRVLAFATAGKVSNHRAKKWAADLRKHFDLGLIVVSREDLVRSLQDPANADVCRTQLGIHIDLSPALVPVAERARAAVIEVVGAWSARPRLAGRPLVDLDAERVVEGEESQERLSVESLRASLVQGRRIILEAPAGRGKTTTLVQIAQRTVDAYGLAFLVDLPAWVRSGTAILQFIAQGPAFAARGLDAKQLLELRGSEPFFFLLNGWNEISEGTAEEAVQALRELERDYPAAGIIVATRTHRLLPPLPGAFRAKLLTLRRAQRDEFLDRALGTSASELRAKLNNSRTLDALTRTPLILAEVTDLFRKGSAIPTTKMGVLGAVMRVVEESEDHHVFLQQAPLGGHASEYLVALAMAMTEKDEVEVEEGQARAIVNSVSLALKEAGQLALHPEPTDVLNELAKRHVLERLQYPGVTFRFEHQQFQEFFAAHGLKGRLVAGARSGDKTQEREFAKRYVNEPKWGESLRMLAEEIARSTEDEKPDKEAIAAGTKLIRMALHVDPMFAADLARSAGRAVWAEVRGEVGKRLRDWYAQNDRRHQECALATMLATGSDDFRDILVPLLTDSNHQVRLAVYHGGGQFLISSLGANWEGTVRSWPEHARVDLLVELARDPWLADPVGTFALSDPSPKVRWNVGHTFAWLGFMDKAEALLSSLDDGSLRESLGTAGSGDIPPPVRVRVADIYEQMYAEATDPLERLRLLYVLRRFGGEKIEERMKSDLDRLPPEGLKYENHALIKAMLEDLQKSDADWVSGWIARKALDKSTWFGGWGGLLTRIPDQERESLYARFSTELLEDAEQRRVLAVLASVADETFAARVFQRACQIRRGISSAPGQDMPKWNLFRQLDGLLKAIAPEKLLEGITAKLEGQPDTLELDVLTDVLPSMNPARENVRSPISEAMRTKLRAYLKRAAVLGADPHGLRANTRAHVALLLADVGERGDFSDIRRLIEADDVRFKEAQAARAKGDHSHDQIGYGFLYLEAVTMIDPAEADNVVVELIRSRQYEQILAQRLPLLARKSKGQQGFGVDRMEFKRIWKSRAGEPDDGFLEERRIRYADALREVIAELQAERGKAADTRGIDHQLIFFGGALAALDGNRSAKLVLELMELPGGWTGWTRVGALESLLVSGVRLSLVQVLRILDPVMKELKSSGIYNNQNTWLFARCLSVMAFVDPPAEGIAKIREILAASRLSAHEMGIVVAALGASRCEDAINVLMDLAGPDGKGVEEFGGEPWIEAVCALGGKRSNDILLSFVDPNAQIFTREFIPDQRHGDLLARLLAERAVEDQAVKAELVRLANSDLPSTKRMLLAKVFGRFGAEEDLVQGLSVLRDDGLGVPYELVRSIEDVFLERRPYGPSGNAYTLSPLGCNAVRKRLFEMAIGDPNRKVSAFALIGQIEAWRLEHGRPADEPRHPVIESDISWPPFLS